MKVAVVGAGMAGLAISWFLCQKSVEVHLFEKSKLGAGASGVAAGLLHPYAGKWAKKNWRADEGMKASRQLLAIAQKATPNKVVVQEGLLRVALSDDQEEAFRKTASLFSDVEWWSAEQAQSAVPGLSAHPGIFVSSALAVDTLTYLEGLWTACAKLGARWISTEVTSLGDLNGYDHVIVSSGAASAKIEECRELPLRPVKGQLLKLPWPDDWDELPFSVNSSAYVVRVPGEKTCWVGSTFEKGFSSAEADIDEACRLILPKVGALFPGLESADVLAVAAGIRASTPNHLPLMKKLNDQTWVLAGLGSKGLLYHALFARELVDSLAR